MTERENGQPRAVQPQSLFASQQFATAIYQSELTYQLRQLGYEIAVGRSGAPEIKGYTQEYLDASSPRSQQIREYLERTGRAGKEPPRLPRTQRATAKKSILRAKSWPRIASSLPTSATRPKRSSVLRESDFSIRRSRSTRLTACAESVTFSRDKNFEREAVVDERALIRDGLRRGMGEVTFAQVRGNLDARLASGEFQIVDRSQSQPARQFTTAKTIEAEHEIVRRVREGRNTVEPVMSRQQAIAVTDQHHASQPRSKERGRGCSQLSRPYSRCSGLRRRGQNDDTLRRSQRRRMARLRGRGLRPDLPRRPPAWRGGRRIRNPARVPCPFAQPCHSGADGISILSMNRALPAPTRCANSLRVSALTTACS